MFYGTMIMFDPSAASHAENFTRWFRVPSPLGYTVQHYGAISDHHRAHPAGGGQSRKLRFPDQARQLPAVIGCDGTNSLVFPSRRILGGWV
jgi:hypothetical protein